MKLTAAVVGAGRQGACAAFDLARLPGVERVLLIDRDEPRLAAAVAHLERLGLEAEIEPRVADAANEADLVVALRGSVAVVSAVPFRFGVSACSAAIEVGAHVVDLGGNLQASRSIAELGAHAEKKGICVVPDCGLMPGLGNVLAGAAVAELESSGARPIDVEIRCGGLPRRPRNALGYELLFSFDGLINEYDGVSQVLREGEIAEEPTLEELEPWTHPRLGALECATTSGGTSTAPDSFRGRVRTYRYRTLRYPGHFEFFRTLKRLGLFAKEKRAALAALLLPALETREPDDVVLLRVDASSPSGDKISREIFDARDGESGFTAMEKTTAFPSVAVLELALEGHLRAGALRLERDLPFDDYLERLARRGLLPAS